MLAAIAAGALVLWTASTNSFGLPNHADEMIAYPESVLAQWLPFFLAIVAIPVVALAVPLFLTGERRTFTMGSVVAGLLVVVAATFQIGGLVYLPAALLAFASTMGNVSASRAQQAEPGSLIRLVTAVGIGSALWLTTFAMAIAQGIWPLTEDNFWPLGGLFSACTPVLSWSIYHVYRARFIDTLRGRFLFGISTSVTAIALTVISYTLASSEINPITFSLSPNPAQLALLLNAAAMLVAPLVVPSIKSS